MELQHLEVKLPASAAADFDVGAAIPVFHEWIRTNAQPELLLDVADYRHVPGGPGVLLMGHEADYALDEGGHRLGVLYRRKSTQPGSNAERLGHALRSAVRAARQLTEEPALAGRFSVQPQSLDVVVNDRLLVPNTAESAEALLPELQAWFADALGHTDFTLERHTDPRLRFGVTLRAERPIDLDALLARLSG